MRRIFLSVFLCLSVSAPVWSAAEPDPAPVPVPVPVPVADPEAKADPDPQRTYSQSGLAPPTNNYASPNRQNNGDGLDDPACKKLGNPGDCIEKIKSFEFRPFIQLDKQYYKVHEPQITYTDIKTVSEYPKEVRMPKPFTTKVPVYHVKEHPMTKTLTKIKEVVEKIPVVNTEVIETEKKIPVPVVTQENLEVAEIRKIPRKLTLKNPVKKPKEVVINRYNEVPRIINVDRPKIKRVTEFVNVTTIQYIEKRVEVPKVVKKTIRLPRPVKRDGGIIYADKTNVKPVRAEYDEEFPEYYDDPVESTKVEKVPKTIKVPFMETTRVVRPILVEAPIVIPQKMELEIDEHQLEAGPQIAVPCGVITPGNKYLPGPCPACDNKRCPTCPECGPMPQPGAGYSYNRPPQFQNYQYQ